MNKLKVLAVLCAFLSLVSFSSYADDQSSGCGLGWAVTKRNSLLSSSTRQTTNAIASNTIAMTLGTSGCAKHDIVMKNKEAQFFAEANYQKLQSEMAEGRGEYLAAFANVLGCKAGSEQDLGQAFQQNYSQIWTSDSLAPSTMLSRAANIAHTVPACVN